MNIFAPDANLPQLAEQAHHHPALNEVCLNKNRFRTVKLLKTQPKKAKRLSGVTLFIHCNSYTAISLQPEGETIC